MNSSRRLIFNNCFLLMLLVLIGARLPLEAESLTERVRGIVASRQHDDTLRNSLMPLPWARQEVAKVTSMFKGAEFVGAKATESSFKANAQQADIIHLATHAVVDNDKPMFSRIVFAADATDGEDGYLNTYELYGMDLQAKLAVLSACNTGYGKLIRGEGVMSLARGFHYAGCPSMIISLWPIPDSRSTSLMMSDLYVNLGEGQRKDKALREAKLKYLRAAGPAEAAPFYWAGFAPMGDQRALAGSRDLRLGYQILAVVSLILLPAIVLIARGRKKS